MVAPGLVLYLKVALRPTLSCLSSLAAEPRPTSTWPLTLRPLESTFVLDLMRPLTMTTSRVSLSPSVTE